MSEIDAEFALGKSLSGYRGVTWYKDDNTSGTFPSLGAISMYDFYSKRKTRPAWSTSATGGSITDSNGYRYHTFNGSGTFRVTLAGYPSATVEYLVIAGGASGGRGCGGGGGAGGYITGSTSVSAQDYSIVIGAGGAGHQGTSVKGINGNDSSAFGQTAIGGGGGGSYLGDWSIAPYPALSGGSGGGASAMKDDPGGAGTPGQGNRGGTAVNSTSGAYGGGGGAGGIGGAGGTGSSNGGTGGAGLTWFDGVARGGGGGGSNSGSQSKPGGTASAGGSPGGSAGANSLDATANTGGGSGGTGFNQSGAIVGAGGSGIVVIRYLL